MSKHSAIEIQISARVAKPRNGRRIPDRVIQQAIIRKSQTGEDVSGIDLRIIRWKHPHERWNDGRNTAEEWLRFGRFLHSASISLHQVRSHRSR